MRDARRSIGAGGVGAQGENMLVHGENLTAMRRLQADASMRGRFRCIYLDPPFNTGRRFAEYGDQRSPEEWRAMMRARLEAMHPLLAEDGAVFAEIDDTELGALQLVMDDVFGRHNRIATVTIVRSASTGHKARNAGPVNVADYMLLYAKEKARWRASPHVRPQVRVRSSYDFAYSTYVENRNDAPEQWRFTGLRKHVCTALGYASVGAAARALGREAWDHEVAQFALDHHAHVVRFAQPRYEAVSVEARAWIDRSKADPERVFSMKRHGFKPLILRGGNRILFLSDKVQMRDGKAVLVEPLTSVWDDVPFQGIAREGGVVFSRNKKPERLLERVIAMSTAPGDWVLDPFLGSGTTAAVAHKMGRRWVGIEEGAHVDDLCIPRLRRVVDGSDQSGVSRVYGWSGGGGFGVYA